MAHITCFTSLCQHHQKYNIGYQVKYDNKQIVPYQKVTEDRLFSLGCRPVYDTQKHLKLMKGVCCNFCFLIFIFPLFCSNVGNLFCHMTSKYLRASSCPPCIANVIKQMLCQIIFISNVRPWLSWILNEMFPVRTYTTKLSRLNISYFILYYLSYTNVSYNTHILYSFIHQSLLSHY